MSYFCQIFFRPKIFLIQNDFQWKLSWEGENRAPEHSKLASAKVLLELEFDAKDQVLYIFEIIILNRYIADSWGTLTSMKSILEKNIHQQQNPII